MKLEQIEWVDSRQPISSWFYLESFEPLGEAKCISVGFIITEDKHHVTITQSIADVGTDEAQAMGALVIPKKAIKTRTSLPAKPKTKEAV